MEPCIRDGIDVDYEGHRVGVAGPDGAILDGLRVSRVWEDLAAFFRRMGRHGLARRLPVAVEGRNGYALSLDEIRFHGWRPYSVSGRLRGASSAAGGRSPLIAFDSAREAQRPTPS